MSNSMIPSNTGSKPSNTLQLPAGKQNPSSLIGFFKRAIGSILGNNSGNTHTKQAREKKEITNQTHGNTLQACHVDLTKVLGTSRFIATTQTVYTFLFGDNTHITHSTKTPYQTPPGLLVSEVAVSTSPIDRKNHTSIVKLPQYFCAHYQAILQDAWLHVISCIPKDSPVQISISEAMHEKFSLLEQKNTISFEIYKQTVQQEIEMIRAQFKATIQGNPSVLLENYGVTWNDIAGLMDHFLEQFHANEFIQYTAIEFIGGIHPIFGKGCIEAILESIGTEYLYKFPTIHRNKELRVGPYMISLENYTEEMKHVTQLLLGRNHLLPEGYMNSQESSVLSSLFHAPHAACSLICIDRFLQFIACINHMQVRSNSTESNTSLQHLFERIANQKNHALSQEIEQYLTSFQGRGIYQLMKILLLPISMHASFASDIHHWIQYTIKHGLIDFHDHMSMRFQVEGVQVGENRARITQ